MILNPARRDENADEEGRGRGTFAPRLRSGVPMQSDRDAEREFDDHHELYLEDMREADRLLSKAREMDSERRAHGEIVVPPSPPLPPTRRPGRGF